MAKKTTKKLGALSTEESEYIKNNAATQSIYDIAREINRTPERVKRFIKENALQGLELSARDAMLNVVRYDLYQKNIWPEIQKQFSKENGELDYFVSTWVNLVDSFGGDIKPAEELQLKQLVTVEILMNRSMTARNEHLTLIDDISKKIQEEMGWPSPDMARMALLESQALNLKAALNAFNNDIIKFQERQSKIFHDLKALREQRISRVTDSKGNWASLATRFADLEFRESEGRELALMKLATDKAREKLSGYHKFSDNLLDRPLFSAETIKEKEDK